MRTWHALPALVTASALVLAGCSGSPAPTDGETEAPEDVQPTGAPTASTDPQGAPSGPGADGADGDADGGGASAQAADGYCPAADEGYLAMIELLDATDRKSAETGDEAGGDVGVMREAGSDMLTAMETVEDAWGTALERLDSVPWDDAESTVTTAEGAEAYGQYFAYLDAFARPEAEIAAGSATMEDYSLATTALLSEPGVAQTAAEGAAAIGIILEYTLERCGDLPVA